MLFVYMAGPPPGLLALLHGGGAQSRGAVRGAERSELALDGVTPPWIPLSILDHPIARRTAFRDLLLTEGNGVVLQGYPIPGKTAGVSTYKYKLYAKNPDGSFVKPPALRAPEFTKTTVIGFAANWSQWAAAAQEAIEGAVRAKQFPKAASDFVGTSA